MSLQQRNVNGGINVGRTTSLTMSHVVVRRNRRRQMNEHLKVLRSLTPWFYIKRGGQASVISGVIEFIKELDRVVRSLEANKRRMIRTNPTGGEISPYGMMNIHREVEACCNSPVANVEAKVLGSNNVIVRAISRRIPGQIVRIIRALEKLCFQIVEMNVSSMEDTVSYSFVIKEKQVSVEEIAFQVQRSFSFCQGTC